MNLTSKERDTLVTLLKRRVVFTEDLRAYNFMKRNASKMTPFSGVFVPPQNIYPIKGRFFLKQQADTMKGYVDNMNGAQINGSITVTKEGKLNFDARVHWPNQDYTTIGVKKASQGDCDQNRLGQFDGDRMTFPFYHSTYQVGTGDGYLNSSNSTNALWRLRFSSDKEAVLGKAVENLRKFQTFYKNKNNFVLFKVNYTAKTALV